MSLESPTELRISEWISLANECNIFVTLGLDCNRVDRSQNGTCNAELSSIKPESRESIQSKITEPACAEFSATQVGNSAKQTNHSVRSDKPVQSRTSCDAQLKLALAHSWLFRVRFFAYCALLLGRL